MADLLIWRDAGQRDPGLCCYLGKRCPESPTRLFLAALPGVLLPRRLCQGIPVRADLPL